MNYKNKNLLTRTGATVCLWWIIYWSFLRATESLSRSWWFCKKRIPNKSVENVLVVIKPECKRRTKYQREVLSKWFNLYRPRWYILQNPRVKNLWMLIILHCSPQDLLRPGSTHLLQNIHPPSNRTLVLHYMKSISRLIPPPLASTFSHISK